MQRTHTMHKLMRHFSPRCNRTTPWRWRILQRLHNPTEHWSCCSRRKYWRYQARLLTSLQNSQQHKPRTPGLKYREIGQPRPRRDIRHPATRPRQIQPQANIEIYAPEADRSSALTGTAPPTAKMWRRHTCTRRVASPIIVTTSQLCD